MVSLSRIRPGGDKASSTMVPHLGERSSRGNFFIMCLCECSLSNRLHLTQLLLGLFRELLSVFSNYIFFIPSGG